MNQVFDEPLLMSSIAKHLSVNDLVNLKVSGDYGERFYDTLSYELDKRQKEIHAKKLKDFEKNVALILKEPNYTVRQLNHLFDFLADNRWFRDEPKFRHIDDAFQANLIRLATENYEYAHDALFYLDEIYGIHVQANYDEDNDTLVEYIKDLNGNKYQL